MRARQYDRIDPVPTRSVEHRLLDCLEGIDRQILAARMRLCEFHQFDTAMHHNVHISRKIGNEFSRIGAPHRSGGCQQTDSAGLGQLSRWLDSRYCSNNRNIQSSPHVLQSQSRRCVAGNHEDIRLDFIAQRLGNCRQTRLQGFIGLLTIGEKGRVSRVMDT